MEIVSLRLPEKLLSDAGRVASAQDVTIGHLVRVLLAKEVERRLHPKIPNRADEGLVAALQALLAKDMAEAEGWDDLGARLQRHGYELRPAGGGVALYKKSCGTRVCKGSELGFAYRALVRRFAAPMPGHPHGTLGEEFPERADYPKLDSTKKGRLQRTLEPVFKAATNWEILAERLSQRNYTLRAQGTGLAIYCATDGRHVCNTATVGYRYRALVKRFGCPMPGHSHGMQWVAPQNEQQDAEPVFDVIERSYPHDPSNEA